MGSVLDLIRVQLVDADGRVVGSKGTERKEECYQCSRHWGVYRPNLRMEEHEFAFDRKTDVLIYRLIWDGGSILGFDGKRAGETLGSVEYALGRMCGYVPERREGNPIGGSGDKSWACAYLLHFREWGTYHASAWWRVRLEENPLRVAAGM